MEEFGWIFWMLLGLALIAAEIFTAGFVLLWFGIGALAAALASMVGLGYPFQFLVFFVVSAGLTAASRTIFSSYFVSEGDGGGGRKFGADSLPGQTGTVVTSSSGAMLEGAVKVFGSTWTAYPAEGEGPLEAGERVTVESVRGASIYVRRADAEHGWRGRALPEGEKE